MYQTDFPKTFPQDFLWGAQQQLTRSKEHLTLTAKV